MRLVLYYVYFVPMDPQDHGFFVVGLSIGLSLLMIKLPYYFFLLRFFGVERLLRHFILAHELNGIYLELPNAKNLNK